MCERVTVIQITFFNPGKVRRESGKVGRTRVSISGIKESRPTYFPWVKKANSLLQNRGKVERQGEIYQGGRVGSAFVTGVRTKVSKEYSKK